MFRCRSIYRFLGIAAAAFAVFAAGARAADYHVGPGQALAEAGEVPWESLSPGDRVFIHWRAEPYLSKWVLCRQGTAGAWITVSGVPGPGGELPVIDGNGATTRSQLNYWNENRGVIKIGGANTPPDTTPSYILVENLEIRSARPPYGYTGRNGAASYINNASAIYVEKGEHLVIRNCVFHDCGNGFFSASESADLLIEGCYIYDNGIVGSIYEHNNYTESNGIVFQFNRFGPLRSGCLGNNLKDRSAGLVVRYNWIESGNRQLDLVDSDHPELVALPSYRSTFVYGNILIEPNGAGNSQICHYGGDSGDADLSRKGTLYFYNNTVVSTRSGNTTLFRLSSNEETCDARNNIFYVTAGGSALAYLDDTGALDLRNNWRKAGAVGSHGGVSGTITDHGGAVIGTLPGFLDSAGQDFRLAGDSACRDAATALPAAASPLHLLGHEYLKHQQSSARPVLGPLDIGAFEYFEAASRAGGAWAGYP